MSNKFYIFGVEIDNITLRQALDKAKIFLTDGKSHVIITPNPEIVLKAKKDSEYREILNQADLKLPDGYGLVLASKILKRPLRQRVAGVDFLKELLICAETHHYSCYILLLDSGLTEKNSLKYYLLKHYPGLEYTCQSVNEYYLASGHLLNDINTAAPDILIVTFGAPKQEIWLNKNLKRLPRVQIGFAVGGAFDMLTGKITRAPGMLRNLRLEWLWRLFKQPNRAIRIFNAVAVFMWHIFVLRFKSMFIFRKNVLAFIYKNKNSILIIHKSPWSRNSFWAMIQGGVEKEEDLITAIKREIREEVGMTSINITASSKHKNRYRWSSFYRNIYSHQYAGQKQKCFFVKFRKSDKEIKINNLSNERIDGYMWVDQKELLEKLEPRRRPIVKKLLIEFNHKKIYTR